MRVMTSLSETFLSGLNTWLQWIAIVGTGLGLLSALGLFLVTSELSNRQDKRLAAAQQDASNAQKLADNLQLRLKPRTVSPEQREKFLAAVKDVPKGKLSVFSYMSADPGTIQYANGIREMIVAAGFDSGIMVGMGMGGSIPVGAAIAVKDKDNQPPFAGPVQRALSDIGIPLPGVVDPGMGPDEVKILVGLKPDDQ